VEFGRLLNDAWLAKRSLSAEVSNAFVDDLYNRAKKSGAVGGKLMGAGGGGFLVLFVPRDRQGEVRKTLQNLIHVPFRFDATGSQIIAFNREQDYSKEESGRLDGANPGFRELAEISPPQPNA
jgi:D-glycero-alpha-D-manno-heptose-7-phosphate kinase